MLELYHWEPTAESLGLLICLNEKGLRFRGHYVDMLQLEHRAAPYLELSPKGIVPLLVADGERMSDTGLALQYLAERYPEPRLAPSEPAAWYELQVWLERLGGTMGLSENVRLLGWNYVMLAAIPPDDLETFRERLAALPRETVSGWSAVWRDAEAAGDRLAKAEERVDQEVTRVEASLGQSGWIVGEEYSIVDMAAYAHLHGLPALLPGRINESETPRVCDWLARIGRRPAVAEAHALRRSGIAPVMYTPPDS